MIRYTVIDNKKKEKYHYHKWQWELAFALIFLSGFGTGVLISFII